MSYIAKNIQIFTAAFAGALAGMGLSDRVISNTDPVQYAGLATIAGAFAQAVDTAWTDTRATTLLDVEAIQSNSAAYWQDRSPNADSTNTNPSTFAAAALSIIATITASESYYASQGITPPAIPGGTSGGFPNVANLTALGAIDWTANGLANGYRYYVQTQRSYWILSQTGTETVNGNTVIAATSGGRWLRDLSFAHPSWANVNSWYVNTTTGNDENDGSQLAPLKTMREFNRRINGLRLTPDLSATGKLLIIHLIGDMVSGDKLDINWLASSDTQVWIRGTVTSVLQNGTFTAVTNMDPTVAGGGQALQVTDNAMAGTWTTVLNQRIRITGGANSGAWGWVQKDLGAKQARLTPLVKNSLGSAITANDATAPTTYRLPANMSTISAPNIGDPYTIESLPKLILGNCNPTYEGAEDAIVRFGAGGVYVDSCAIYSSFNASQQTSSLQLGSPIAQSSWNGTQNGLSFTTYGCQIFASVLMSNVYSVNDFWGGYVYLQSGFSMKLAGLATLPVICPPHASFGTCFDAAFQGAGVRGYNLLLQSLSCWDVVSGANNPAGHAIMIGLDFSDTISSNTVGRAGGGQCIVSNFYATAVAARIWGNGNAGAGFYIPNGGKLIIDRVSAPTPAYPVITGTNGDFNCGVNGAAPSVRAFDDATATFSAATLPTWANLAGATLAGRAQYKNAYIYANG